VSTAVTGHGWLLSLHVLAAFAVGAPVAMLLIVAVVSRRPDGSNGRRSLAGLARVAAGIYRGGLVAALVLGLWLVFTTGGYSITDAWVIAAIVLWLAIGGLGDRGIARVREAIAPEASGGEAPARGPEEGARRSATWWTLGATVAVVAEIGLMIWRPGA
jgi:hypothetical protein